MKIKKLTLNVMSILLLGTVSIVNASDKLDPKKYMNVSIEKNVSEHEVNTYIKDAKDMGIEVVKSPKFTCLDIGYTKANLFEEGILYGTKGKDGNVAVGQKGDFKVYSFIKYFKDGAFCVETSYEKGDARYGNGSIAALRGKQK